MTYQEKMRVEFDPERRIVHLSAEEDIYFQTPEDLEDLYADTCDILGRYTHGTPVYLLVDMANFIIDPSLFEDYGKKSAMVKEKFLYPDGMAGYGFQITRVTVQLSYGNAEKRPALFKTRKEAEEYLVNLEFQRTGVGG